MYRHGSGGYYCDARGRATDANGRPIGDLDDYVMVPDGASLPDWSKGGGVQRRTARAARSVLDDAPGDSGDGSSERRRPKRRERPRRPDPTPPPPAQKPFWDAYRKRVAIVVSAVGVVALVALLGANRVRALLDSADISLDPCPDDVSLFRASDEYEISPAQFAPHLDWGDTPGQFALGDSCTYSYAPTSSPANGGRVDVNVELIDDSTDD